MITRKDVLRNMSADTLGAFLAELLSSEDSALGESCDCMGSSTPTADELWSDRNAADDEASRAVSLKPGRLDLNEVHYRLDNAWVIGLAECQVQNHPDASATLVTVLCRGLVMRQLLRLADGRWEDVVPDKQYKVVHQRHTPV
jgi:hypothetical protein